jgi:hypothetical protein
MKHFEKLNKRQIKRILNSFHYYRRSIDEIAQHLVNNQFNDINSIIDAKEIVKEVISMQQWVKPRPHATKEEKKLLEWLNKSDSETIVTEDDLFKIPLPKEWKLSYIVESKMNIQ